MEQQISLEALFTAKKDELKTQLSGLSVPKDANIIQKRISDCLDSLFESGNEYRKKLTQSEDYILQAALNLLNAQQRLQNKYMETLFVKSKIHNGEPSSKQGNRAYYPLFGTAVGAGVGAAISSWGAVIGALGGTALVIYLLGRNVIDNEASPIQAVELSTKLDVDSYLNILEAICCSVDDLIKTVRIQIQRIQDAYDSRDPDTLFTLYPAFVLQLESLFSMAEDKDSMSEDLSTQIDLIKRSLKNYGIFVKDGKLTK